MLNAIDQLTIQKKQTFVRLLRDRRHHGNTSIKRTYLILVLDEIWVVAALSYDHKRLTTYAEMSLAIFNTIWCALPRWEPYRTMHLGAHMEVTASHELQPAV
jgi:hypothetical protein